MVILLFAAHQGEEFVIILPLIMLVGAFLIMRWANQPAANEGENAANPDDESEAQHEGDEHELVGPEVGRR